MSGNLFNDPRTTRSTLRIYVFLTKRANCGLPFYIKKKGKYRNKDEKILMSFKEFNDSQKYNPCAVRLIHGRKLANDRAGIKHQTLKFLGPVVLGGMNK